MKQYVGAGGIHEADPSEVDRGRVVLTRGSRLVQRLLELTGVGRYLSFVPAF